jgi:O-antigen/teichoic acid export membrane protein
MPLKKRFSFKLATNFVGFFVSIMTQSMVPRALGPAAYGNFSFLTNYFWQFMGFLSFNSSNALYTKLSQRQKDGGLVSFYAVFLLLLAVVLALFLIASFSARYQEVFWPGQSLLIIVMAAAWAYLRFCGDTLILICDALGLTVRSEMVNMSQKLLGLVIIFLLFLSGRLVLRNFFVLQIFLVILSILLFFTVIQRSKLLSMAWHLTRDQVSEYKKEFSRFCLPLVWFSAFAVLAAILDRWFLQKFSGSVEQGFFGLAYQVGAICFLFIGAIMPLISREFAIAFGKKDVVELGRLFSRFAPMLYALAAYFCCFLAIQAKNVVLIFGGRAYADAVVPITIMCLYPMHQVYGQMNGAIYFATDRTMVYRNVGMIFVVLGIFASLFLLGPKKYGALNLGAKGLALQMVCVQLLSVNVQLWHNIRLMRLSFKRFIGHQFGTLFVFLAVAALCSYAVRSVFPGSHFLFSFLFSGVLYTLLIFFLIMAFPSLLALKRQELGGLFLNFKGSRLFNL